MSNHIYGRTLGLVAGLLLLASCGNPVGAPSSEHATPKPSSTTFSIEELRRLAKDAGAATKLDGGSYPRGWSKSTDDPARLLDAFPTLRLKKGLALRAYVFREGGNGNGVIWAMPESAPFPGPDQAGKEKRGVLELPRPEGATGIMQGIEGDGSPRSYLSASLLAREAQEYAALWHGISWGAHQFVGADPWSGSQNFVATDPAQGPSGNPQDWKWTGAPPPDWTPRVEMAADLVTVTFYTYSALGRQAIFRHVDTYRPGQYEPSSRDEEIGTGPPGIVF